MEDITDKIGRLKKFYHVKTDEELATKLNISVNTVRSWKQRKAIPAEYELELMQNESYTSSANADFVDIPYFQDACASAGYGTANHHTDVELMKMSKSFLLSMFGITSYRGLEALNVSGESMSPQLNDGDMIIVLRNAPIKEGRVYVVAYHDEVLVKRVQRNPKTGTVKLISDNSKYGEYIIEDDDLNNLNILGQVVAHIARTK